MTALTSWLVSLGTYKGVYCVNINTALHLYVLEPDMLVRCIFSTLHQGQCM